jgi:hypothetical protein
VLLAAVLAVALSTSADVAAIGGSTPWAVILCKFRDHPEEPMPRQFFRNFFTADGAGQGGMFDYWRDVSYGSIDLAGSNVFGWYTMPFSVADQERSAGDGQVMSGSNIVQSASLNFQTSDVGKLIGVRDYADRVVVDGWNGARILSILDAHTVTVSSPALASVNPAKVNVFKGRWQYTQDCLDTAAQNGVSLFGFYQVAVMINAALDSGNTGGRVILDPPAWSVWYAAHEMGHGYGLPHANSIMKGAYGDNFDAMGAGFAAAGNFGLITPGLNALYLDRLGWLPPSRVASFNGIGDSSFPWSKTITLAALNHPAADGYLALRLTANGRTVTFEFRSKSGWDRGIPQDSVLVHLLDSDGSSLLDDSGGGYGSGTNYQMADMNYNVHVDSIDSAAATATLTMSPVHSDYSGGGAGGCGAIGCGGNQPNCIRTPWLCRRQ